MPNRHRPPRPTADDATLSGVFRAGLASTTLVPRLQIDLALDLWRNARRQARAILRRYADENDARRLRFARAARELRLARPPRETSRPEAAPPAPSSVVEHLPLPDGGVVDVRAMTPADGPALATMLERTTPEDRRLRFMSSGIAITDHLIAKLTGYDPERAIVLCAFRPGTQEMLGVGRLHAEDDPASGEFALLVRSDWHGHRLGPALLEHLIADGRRRGMREIWGHVMAENFTMVHICRHLGFRRDPDRSSPGVHVMVLTLDAATRPV